MADATDKDQPSFDLASAESLPAKSDGRAPVAARQPAPSRATSIQFGPTRSPPGSRLKRTSK
jgi:hypothetical protein